MHKIMISVVFAVSGVAFPFAAIGQEKVEPLLEIARDSHSGGAPSPANIEKAYNECLKGVDAEFAAIAPGVARRAEARKAEEEVCHRARRECVTTPSSASCKGFVVDYAE
jgi:hypothetical protein